MRDIDRTSFASLIRDSQPGQREPIDIMRHGRREFVLISAGQYNELLAAAQRRDKAVEAAPEPERN